MLKCIAGFMCVLLLTGCESTWVFSQKSTGPFIGTGTKVHDFVKTRLCGGEVNFEERHVAIDNKRSTGGSGTRPLAQTNNAVVTSHLECTRGK